MGIGSKRPLARSRADGFLTAGALLLAVVLACSSPEERARSHLEQARHYLAENRRKEATLELQSALQFDPSSVEANNRLAEIELANGNLSAALSYMQEAFRLDPTDSTACLHLASLLRTDQPDRAKELIEAVIEREPENPQGYIGRSDLALAEGRMRAAVAAARKAAELAPDDPHVDWQQGYVLEAMIREGQLTGETAEDSIYKGALAAFERYIEKGGESPWTAQLEEARVLGAWEGRGREAARLFRISVQSALEAGSATDALRGATTAAGYARAVGDDELLEWALGVLVEQEPRDLRNWQTLAELRRRQRKNPEEVWQRMIETLPQEPRAHIEYARFLISRWKLDEALAYLEKKASEGVDPPMLLGAIASTQIAAGRLDDARETVARMEREHPASPRTILERAQLDIRTGQVRPALRSLRKLAEKGSDADVFRMLASAEEIVGNRDRALAAVNHAIEASPFFSYEDQRMRSRMLAESGKYAAAITNLLAIRDRMPLSAEDNLLLARCRYENGQNLHGRKLLEGILATGRPPADAVLEYARRESDDPQHVDLARRELESLLRRRPDQWEALGELVRIDRASGHDEQALDRLDRIIERQGDRVPPQVRLLRAQVNADAGRQDGALADAEAAFRAQPRLRGALEMVIALRLRKGDLDGAIAAAEKAKRKGALDPDRRALLGRLYSMKGRDDEALEVLEQALEDGASDPILKSDVAFLLAKKGRDLERALTIAQEAESELTDDPRAADTLGFVYLRSGQSNRALSHFEQAVARSDAPHPVYYYHLGLALQSLDRSEEAARAFEKALSISPDFPEANEARRALEGTRNARAS